MSYFFSLGGQKLFERKGKVRFVVFEGPDGSGQSTQASLLKNYLGEKGHAVVLTKEPTLESEAGRQIREALIKKATIDPKKLQELFTEDRRVHLEKLIIPSLQASKVVISDRYFFSTFAYGFIDSELEWLIEINKNFILPDMTFILDVSPKVCIERIKKRGKAVQFFEEYQKLAKVLTVYKTFPSKFPNVYIIDGERRVEEVFKDVLDYFHEP